MTLDRTSNVYLEPQRLVSQLGNVASARAARERHEAKELRQRLTNMDKSYKESKAEVNLYTQRAFRTIPRLFLAY
jgi:hypothetical protein